MEIMIDNPQKRWAQRILEKLEEDGHQARLAGGCVRDELIGRKPTDYDVATTALPEEVQNSLSQINAKIIPTGIEHGTVTAVRGQCVVEITTLRSDVSTDGRRATVEFSKSFEVDASRRDFTINALMMDLRGKIYDYFDGQKDINAKILRFVGEPDARIQEDYLRILRLVRFVSQLGFSVDPKSNDALSVHTNGVKTLSGERVWSEIKKTFVGDHAPDALELLQKSGLLTALFGQIGNDPKRIAAASAWSNPDKRILLWGRVAVFFTGPKSIKSWKIATKDRKEILSFVNSVAWLSNFTPTSRDKLGLDLDGLLGFDGVAGATVILQWLQSLDYHGVVHLTQHDFDRLICDAEKLEPLRTRLLPVSGDDLLEAAKIQNKNLKGKTIGILFRSLRARYYMGHWCSKIEGLRVLKTLLEDGEDEII